jgi:WhiB family transcriptional regulator, redox-sensing transcriptional regulator
MSWYHYAACQSEDPELFFPIGTAGPALLQLMEAKRVCAHCPVQNECLRWAIMTGMDYGVWGGMGEDERRALKRQTARHRLLKPQTAPANLASQPR